MTISVDFFRFSVKLILSAQARLDVVNLSGPRLYVYFRDDEVSVVCKLTKFIAWRQHVEITRIDDV